MDGRYPTEKTLKLKKKLNVISGLQDSILWSSNSQGRSATRSKEAVCTNINASLKQESIAVIFRSVEQPR